MAAPEVLPETPAGTAGIMDQVTGKVTILILIAMRIAKGIMNQNMMVVFRVNMKMNMIMTEDHQKEDILSPGKVAEEEIPAEGEIANTKDEDRARDKARMGQVTRGGVALQEMKGTAPGVDVILIPSRANMKEKIWMKMREDIQVAGKDKDPVTREDKVIALADKAAVETGAGEGHLKEKKLQDQEEITTIKINTVPASNQAALQDHARVNRRDQGRNRAMDRARVAIPEETEVGAVSLQAGREGA